MTIPVGIFDLFAYSVPGSLYLALVSYLALRTGLVEPTALTGVNGVLLVVAAVLLSYLFGFLAYPLGELAHRLLPELRRRDPRADFLRRNPAARDREFVRADPHLLLAALQLHDHEVAADITRLRASGLMLRNSAAPVSLAAVVAAVEVFTGPHPVLAAGCAVALLGVAPTLVAQGRKFGRWADIKTLELAFWLPDVDARVRSDDA
ncbi:MAG TPA: hypothetical protein VNP92_09915 [Actinophytocola sp.]|nr:hypothetical protein [Actinophytocola sp.]